MTTAEEIRTLRTALGLTQKQFAKKVRVTWVQVSRWENGHFMPGPLAWHRINKVLFAYEARTGVKIRKF